MEDQILAQQMHQNIFYTPMVSHYYSVSFTQDIEEPSFYDAVINLLLTAEDGTQIDFLISSYGGRLDSFIGIRGALAKTRANVTGYLMAQACSAAGMLLLSCHDWVINEFSTFHCHTCSYGTFGKSDDVKQQVDYTTSQTERIVRSVYADILTEDEQDKLLSGKEYYFDDVEITKRLVHREKVRQQKILDEQANEDEDADLSQFSVEELQEEIDACKKDIKDYQKEIKSRSINQ